MEGPGPVCVMFQVLHTLDRQSGEEVAAVEGGIQSVGAADGGGEIDDIAGGQCRLIAERAAQRRIDGDVLRDRHCWRYDQRTRCRGANGVLTG